ncbi:MAG: ribosome maturation factor RimM [Betaproteobacteria bacterium]|nr:ribosome maturation factor RimM [Betaproteobacteria bacterium]
MVVMGRVTAPFGVKGWVKVYALTAHPGNLRGYPAWWLGHDGDWREMRVASARIHGNTLVAQIEGVADREAAAALRGFEIAVPRERLPAATDDEFYWADLIGLRVVNAEQHEFGRVARILQTGANDVLVVAAGNRDERETLIPFIASAIRQVDLAAGVISVDWGRDY